MARRRNTGMKKRSNVGKTLKQQGGGEELHLKLTVLTRCRQLLLKAPRMESSLFFTLSPEEGPGPLQEAWSSKFWILRSLKRHRAVSEGEKKFAKARVRKHSSGIWVAWGKRTYHEGDRYVQYWSLSGRELRSKIQAQKEKVGLSLHEELGLAWRRGSWRDRDGSLIDDHKSIV